MILVVLADMDYSSMDYLGNNRLAAPRSRDRDVRWYRRRVRHSGAHRGCRTRRGHNLRQGHHGLLTQILIITQDRARHDTLHVLYLAPGPTVGDTNTQMDVELSFIRVLADLGPLYIRCLRIDNYVSIGWDIG
jgi:hypothetical protein